MVICQNCFNDKTIKNIIRRNDLLGKCDYCKSENTYIIDMDTLINENIKLISEIFELYENKNKAEYRKFPEFYMDIEEVTSTIRKNIEIQYDTLLNLLQKNWNFFNTKNIKEDDAYEVLLFWMKKMGIDYEYYKKVHLKSQNWCDCRYKLYGYFVKEDWEIIRESIKHEYRFYISNSINLNFKIEDLLSTEMFDRIAPNFKKGTKFYRGRINNEGKSFSRKEMLIPPKEIKSVGRANPIGINYLYATNNIETVLAEVRAWKGCTVSVATIELNRDFSLIDLTFLEKPTSIFDQGSFFDFNITRRMEYFEILDQLHRTMSKPIDPREANLDYLITQYICETIKVLGYDGVIFNSSLGEGKNVVLFSDKEVKVKKEIIDYTVKNIKYIKI